MAHNLQSLSAENLPNTTFEKPQPKPYQQIQVEGKKSFQCLAPGCEKIFKFKSDMERHVLIHTKEKPITCPYPDCKKGFKRPDALRYHVDTMHINHQIFTCPLPDCGHQTHKKELFEGHLGKHSYIRALAEYSPNDGKIYVPWKKIVGWERRYWIKYKTNFEQQKQNNKGLLRPFLSESSLRDLKSDWNVLSCFEEEEDSGVSEKFFEQLEFLKNKGQHPADPISLESFDDDISCSISGVGKQMTQESEGNQEKQFDLYEMKSAAREKPYVCPYPSCNQTFRKLDELKFHLFPTHVDHQIFVCPLADCGYQTHKKEVLEFYHLGKHDYIRECAENSPDDGKIYLPWKNIADWERRAWANYKAEFAERENKNQGSLLGSGLEDLKSDWDILSCLEEDPGRSERFFEQIESWKNKERSRDVSDTLSLASFRDESPCLITGARDLLRSICKQITQESEENKGKLPDLPK